MSEQKESFFTSMFSSRGTRMAALIVAGTACVTLGLYLVRKKMSQVSVLRLDTKPLAHIMDVQLIDNLYLLS